MVYHDKFYRDVLDAGDLAKLAYYNDIVVGAVCCRVDTSAESGERKLYIMTLGELSIQISLLFQNSILIIRHLLNRALCIVELPHDGFQAAWLLTAAWGSARRCWTT